METVLLNLDEEATYCARLVSTGKVILYPTDTIWGMGCSIRFPETLERIFQIKERPASKSTILLVDSMEMLKRFVKRIHPRVETLLTLHNRPLTVIYPDPIGIPEYLLAQDGSVALRICKDLFCEKLIQQLNEPIVSTSANISGSPSPTSFGSIETCIKENVDYIVQYRQNDVTPSEASTIIRYDSEGELTIVRP